MTMEDLNILLFSSYDVHINMVWLEAHGEIIHFLIRRFTYIDELGKLMEVVGFPRVVSIRKLSIIQVKKCVRK